MRKRRDTGEYVPDTEGAVVSGITKRTFRELLAAYRAAQATLVPPPVAAPTPTEKQVPSNRSASIARRGSLRQLLAIAADRIKAKAAANLARQTIGSSNNNSSVRRNVAGRANGTK